MTALERAVDAVMSVERSYGDAFDVAEEGATNIVRAVLMAIQEPDDAMCDLASDAANEVRPGTYEFYCSREMFAAGHKALIDAILNETPE